MKKILSNCVAFAALLFSANIFAGQPVLDSSQPEGQALPIQFTSATAPDAVSRLVLKTPLTSFHAGSISKEDIPETIHRNYPQIIEQNFARMTAAHAMRWVNQLSDTELKGIAQLYVNANADSGRNGKLLLIAADRLDATHLARLSKFFGNTPIYDAILQVAPLKAQSFTQNASVIYSAPIVGALSPAASLANERSVAMGFEADSAKLDPYATPAAGGTGFKPNVSMTLDEIYTGFRGMTIGETAVTAALYETAAYAGLQLTVAWGAGYGFGTGISNLMQTYAPDWYSNTFVPLVGNTVTYLQNVVDKVGSFYGGSLYDLGHYESSFAPTFSVPTGDQVQMETTGGDNGVTSAWQFFYSSGPTNKCPQNPQVKPTQGGSGFNPDLFCTTG